MPSSEGMKPSPADAAERSGFGHSISAVGDRRDLFGDGVVIISHGARADHQIASFPMDSAEMARRQAETR